MDDKIYKRNRKVMFLIDFFMDMIPPTSTHQQRGCTMVNGKLRYYDRNNGDAEQKLTAYLSKHIPEKPFSGPLRVVTKWCFPIKAKHKDGEPYTNKPDADNICKSLYDIMTKLSYWKDDKQIYSSITEKFWAERPGIYVRIEEEST